MINWMFHDTHSSELLCLPLPNDNTLAKGVELVADRFVKDVIGECLTHFTPEDCDPARYKYQVSMSLCDSVWGSQAARRFHKEDE